MLAVFIESVSVGAEIVFGKRMVIKQVLKDLKEAKVTMFLGVPLLFNKLLAGIMKGVKEKGPIVYGLIHVLMGISFVDQEAHGQEPRQEALPFGPRQGEPLDASASASRAAAPSLPGCSGATTSSASTSSRATASRRPRPSSPSIRPTPSSSRASASSCPGSR